MRRFIAVCAALVVGAVAAAPAWSVEPKKPSQIVFLTSSGNSGDCLTGIQLDERRDVDPSGEPFAIPKGHVLVVTSWNYCTLGSDNFASSPNLALSGGNTSAGFSVIWKPANTAFCTDVEIPGGVVVRPKNALCAVLLGSGNVRVHGYLVKGK